MLVLTRKVGESILIGDEIKITVTKIGNKKVGIGIDAPRSVQVVRTELDVRNAGGLPVGVVRVRDLAVEEGG